MPPISAACSHLLNHSRRYQPLYGDRLANHLPMALIALDRMGAGGQQLAAFAVRYEDRLRLREPQQNAGDFFERALLHFAQAVREHGAVDIIREWLPALLPGVSTSAFHCVIRLAYAVEAQDDDEISMALAYWATSFEILGPLGPMVDQSPDQIAADLLPKTVDVAFSPGIIIDRMQQISHALAQRGLDLQPRVLTLGDVARFALSVYTRQEDFTLLHTVTGTHALRILLPYVSDRGTAVRWLWQGVLAAYLTVEHRISAQVNPDLSMGWEDCFSRARASADDHLIKLSYTAYEEGLYYADEEAYLAVAMRKSQMDRR